MFLNQKDYNKNRKDNQEKLTFNWLKKWKARKEKSQMLAEVYKNSKELSLARKAWKVEMCGDFMLFDACPTGADGHTKRLKAGSFCDDRLCPICNRKRAIKIIVALMQVLEPLRFKYKIIFMTLTVKNVAEINHDVYKKLLENWKKFQENFLLGRKHKNEGNKHYYAGPCVGGVIAVETTYNGEQEEGLVWHPHIHGILVCKEYINQKAASEYWKKITGDSFIVGFSEVKVDGQKGLLEGVLETVKYLAKLSYDMPDEKIIELAMALRRVRCMNGFGVLKSYMSEAKERRKKEEKKSVVCKKCGKDLVELAIKWYGEKYVKKNMTEAREKFLKKCCCNERKK